jgi:hypothetical protein
MRFILPVGLFALVATAFADPISFPECPAVGADTTGCELLITVTAVNGSGAAIAFSVAASSPDLGPFEHADDTLVGILNSAGTGTTLTSIALSSGLGIFFFDGDGACNAFYSPGPTLAQCGLASFTYGPGPSDYESAGATFTGINAAGTSGTVLVNLANCESTWFSLGEALTPSSITGGTSGAGSCAATGETPEPSSVILLGSVLAALTGLAWARTKRPAQRAPRGAGSCAPAARPI